MNLGSHRLSIGDCLISKFNNSRCKVVRIEINLTEFQLYDSEGNPSWKFLLSQESLNNSAWVIEPSEVMT